MYWNPIERLRQAQARRRYLPHAQGTTKTGTIARISIVALVIILLASALLELRGDREGTALAKTLASDGVAPLDLVDQATRGRRLTFIADVPGSVAAKRFMADAIERVTHSSGLDVVGLEVDADEQPYIDAYLNTEQEDAGLLLSRPRAVHEGEGVGNSYLEIYRRVRQLNDSLGPDRRIRVLALDSKGWPPASAVSPAELARRYGERDRAMAEQIQGFLQRTPRARMLLFLSGMHALKSGGAVLQTGGTGNVEVIWTAARLRALYPQDVYTFLLDAPSAATRGVQVAAYRGTAAGPLLERTYRGKDRAITITPEFNFSRQPIRTTGAPGVNFDFTPHAFTFANVADAYIYLGQ